MYEEAKPKRKREEIPGAGEQALNILAALGRLVIDVMRYSINGAWTGVKWSAIGTWRALKWTGRWSWRGVVFTAALAWAITVWIVLLPWRLLGGLWRWWRGPEPYFESERERDIYLRIRRRFRRRNRFRVHLLGFILFNAFLWSQLLTSLYSDPRPALVLLVTWTIVLLFHYLHLRSGEAEDDALTEALERERAYTDTRDSARYLRLVDDDGEFYEDIPAKRKRG